MQKCVHEILSSQQVPRWLAMGTELQTSSIDSAQVRSSIAASIARLHAAVASRRASKAPARIATSSPSASGCQASCVSGTLATQTTVCPAWAMDAPPLCSGAASAVGQIRCLVQSPGGSARPVICIRRWQCAKNCIAIGIEEVGRPERAQLMRELAQHRQADVQRRWTLRLPERAQSRQQRAERMLRIGLPDGAKVVERKRPGSLSARQVTVVGEDMPSTTQLAHEGLGVRERQLTPGCVPDVRDRQFRCWPLRFETTHQRAVRDCARFAEQRLVVPLLIRHDEVSMRRT